MRDEVEDRYSEVQRLAHVGDWTWDVATDVVTWSDEAYRIFGREPGSVHTFADAMASFHPDDIPAMEESARLALAGATRSAAEVRAIRADGEERVVELSTEGEQDASGAVVRMAGTFLDVTDRVRVERALRDSERRLAESQRMAHLGSWEWDPLTGELTWSDEMFRIHGLTPGTPPSLDELVAATHEDDRDTFVEEIRQATVRDDPREFDKRIVRPDGEVRWVHVRGEVVRDAHGDPVKVIGTDLDVTPLRLAEERFRAAFDSGPVGMALLSDGRVGRANAEMHRLLHQDVGTLTGTRFLDLVHPSDLAGAEQGLERLLRGDLVSWTAELALTSGDRHTVWTDLHAVIMPSSSGEARQVLLHAVDATERRRHQMELEYLADHDSVTGLLNRRGFSRSLDEHLAEADRYGTGGALLVLDLDRFKQVNDALGHSVGDRVIAMTADALRRRLRASDLVGRLGGDEFAVLLPHAGRDQATRVAQSVIDEIDEHVRVVADSERRTYEVSSSIGVALLTAGASRDDVLHEADRAMYRAKAQGRGRFAFADEAPDAGALSDPGSWAAGEQVSPRGLARQIETALVEDRFVLYAQRVVDLASGTPVHHEVLVRLREENGDLLPATGFVDVAERLGLLADIDRWVTSEAVALACRLQERGEGGHTVEVNLSSASLRDDRLLHSLAAELDRCGLDPAQLVFEVTETTAVAAMADTEAFAVALRELGCRFALDDVGAGIGAMSYIARLPFDYLKIDGGLVQGCTGSVADEVLVLAIVGIAHGLGRRSIAEHVGDAQTLERVRALGVDLAQGNHLGVPVPVQTVSASPGAGTRDGARMPG